MKKYCIIIATLLGLASCRNEFNREEQITPQTDPQKAFEAEFTKKYGTVSPDLSWMTVSSDTLCADLSALEKGSYTIQVYTANPCAEVDYCYLLAEYKNVPEIKDVEFDYPTGLNNIFVSAIDSDNNSYTAHIDVRNRDDREIVFDPETPDSVHYDAKPMTYIMAFEGFTGDEDGLDFDYNDVIAEIEYVRGRESAEIRVVAAGCECAAQLAFRRKGTPEKGDDEILFDEVHEALGFEGVYDYVVKHLVYLALGTGINNAPRIGTTTLDLSDNVNASIAYLVPKIFAKFTMPATNPKDEKSSTAFLPAKKGANYPQAILIADPTWKWSVEGLLLSATYSQFRPWIYGPEGNELWYGAKNWKEANKNFE